jgi:hypothetical protein
MQTPRRTHVPQRVRFKILGLTCIDVAPPTTSQPEKGGEIAE